MKSGEKKADGWLPGASVFQPGVQQPRFTLEGDLIASDETTSQLNECLARLQHHRTIYVDWNFASVDPLGRAAVLNFYGPPGTGKTLAAEALAGTLKLPFMPLGIAELESKFIGETAKNIVTAFETAERESALLFFDEADTLLGKRLSVVTQGVDNEINAMRTTLFIELGKFSGVVVFATNLAKSYDEAFRSRLSYHVHFTLPDLRARRRLWDRMIVPQIPLAADRNELVERGAAASEGMSGRDIRTCMRLALLKSLIAACGDPARARLRAEDVDAAIADVRRAQRDIASPVPVVRDGDATRLGQQLLGLDRSVDKGA